MGHRVAPTDPAARVVADERRLLLPEVFDDGLDIADELVECVVLHPLGLIAQVEAALIDGHDLEMLGERRNLVAPGVPEIGNAVDEDDERTAPLGDVVNLDAAGIREAVLAQVVASIHQIPLLRLYDF